MQIEKVAFDIAYAQLRGQKEDLKSFRAQASFCAALSGLIATAFSNFAGTSFLTASDASQFSFLGIALTEWFVLFCFGSSIAFAILAIVHWKEVVFELSPATSLHFAEHSGSYENPQAEMYKFLANDAEKYFDRNEDVVGQIKTYLFLSLCFAFFQIPAWVLYLTVLI